MIPGSHLWGPDRAPKTDEVTYAEMEPGSALFTLGCKYFSDLPLGWSSANRAATYHGAGENKCERDDPDALRTLFAVFG